MEKPEAIRPSNNVRSPLRSRAYFRVSRYRLNSIFRVDRIMQTVSDNDRLFPLADKPLFADFTKRAKLEKVDPTFCVLWGYNCENGKQNGKEACKKEVTRPLAPKSSWTG